MKKIYLIPKTVEVKVDYSKSLLQSTSPNVTISGNPAEINGDGDYKTVSRGTSWFDED
ncbi:MAG: hypothetical protein IJV34_01935 [Prevotella sp.]|nr:hypothetical protein [Prevotella sp.]